MTTIKKIEQWQKERLLDKQQFNHKREIKNIIEELLEMIGTKDEELITEYFTNQIYDEKELTDIIDVEDTADALCDIIVFAIGGLMKLGLDPECALEETYEEINSRTGSIIDGKFQKDRSNEVKKNWYKADYKHCIKGAIYETTNL